MAINSPDNVKGKGHGKGKGRGKGKQPTHGTPSDAAPPSGKGKSKGKGKTPQPTASALGKGKGKGAGRGKDAASPYAGQQASQPAKGNPAAPPSGYSQSNHKGSTGNQPVAGGQNAKAKGKRQGCGGQILRALIAQAAELQSLHPRGDEGLCPGAMPLAA